MATIDGSIQLVKVVTDADLRQNGGSFVVAGRMAQPIQGFDTLTKRAGGGNAIPVYVVSDAQIADGTFRLKGGSALPMADIDVVAAGVKTIQGAAIPVYVVSGALAGAGGAAPLTLLSGLVSYWGMSEETGNRANSIAGESPAVPVDGPTATPGLVGQAAQLNTTAPLRYFTVAATDSSIPTTATRTWAMALKWDNLSTQPGILSSSNLTDMYALMLGASNIIRFRLTTGGLNSLDSQAVITATDTWYIVRFWYDSVAGEIGIQVNDNAKKTLSVTGAPAWGSTGWNVGRYGSFAHDGVMDETAVWNRVLTDDEWTELRAAWEGGTGYPFEISTSPMIEIFSPSEYQVFQRDGSDLATIAITGRVLNVTSDIEARWNGGSWATIAVAASGDFSGSLANQTAGQGTLEIRLVDYPAVSESLAYVGIGDVFVIAGQSNASGRGTNSQSYSHATLKACVFANDGTWKEMADPTDLVTNQLDSVSLDSPASSGSPWTLLATSIMADQGVPVAFVPCAMGGTSITAWLPGANHLNRTTLYGSMNYRAQQTGAKVILWWQGETDAIAAMTQATYNGHLDTLTADIVTDIGCKIMPCKLQNSSGISDANEAAINDAIGEAWADNVNVLTGPDLSDIASDDAFHLQSDAKLLTAANRWWTALEAEFYS